MSDSIEVRTSTTWRPRYHVSGERNWINDPNGPIHHAGRYHLFFQANEHAPAWGPPSWGHVSSDDLVTWRRHPVALAPQPGGPDADGCWSGSALVLDGRPAVYYTGVVGHHDARVESVCRAWGSADLLAWERDVANPLVPGPPPGRDSGYHRDPFLWCDGDGWHMLLGSGTVEGDRHGQILRYDSPDASAWTYGGVFFEAPRTLAGLDLGEHWECPQLVWGDDGAVALIVSCQSPDAERPLMHSVGFVGAVHGGRLEAALQGVIDHGDVFYAPAVCTDARGRTLLWGWLQERLDADRQASLSHVGALSLPRQAKVDHGGLTLSLVPEVQHLRQRRLDGNGRDGYDGRDQMELVAACGGGTGSATWTLGADGADVASIGVDLAAGHVAVTTGDQALRAPLAARGEHELRVFVDGSAVEVFVDHDVALSTRCYPPASWDHARIACEGDIRLLGTAAWALSAEAVG